MAQLVIATITRSSGLSSGGRSSHDTSDQTSVTDLAGRHARGRPAAIICSTTAVTVAALVAPFAMFAQQDD